MGRRGPAPASDAAKLARGETRPSRLNGLEPLPRSSRPSMPPGMDPVAQAAWRHVWKEFGDSGVLTGADTHLLRLYCEAYSRYVEAAELYAKGSPLLSKHGTIVKNPLHQVVRESADQVRLFARELGLSPAARANLQIRPSAGDLNIDSDLGPPLRLLKRSG